jgi:FlaA1/EpsC-like NDP-sugar epimerase
MNKKILVTGASGHLGGMLFKSLANLGYKNLIGTDLKKKNIKKMKNLFLLILKTSKQL